MKEIAYLPGRQAAMAAATNPIRVTGRNFRVHLRLPKAVWGGGTPVPFTVLANETKVPLTMNS